MSDSQTIVVSTEQFRQAEIARSREEASKINTSTTIPGGLFIAEDGETFVDSNGNPVTIKSPEEKVAEARAALAAAEAEARIVTGGVAPPAVGPDMEPFLTQSGGADTGEDGERPAITADDLADPSNDAKKALMDGNTNAELVTLANQNGVNLEGARTKSDVADRLVAAGVTA